MAAEPADAAAPGLDAGDQEASDPPARRLAIGEPRRTARLVLRGYRAGDLAAFHDLFGRDDVCRYIPFGPLDAEQARSKLELRMRQTRIDADGDALLFAAEEISTSRMIGELMLRLSSARARQGEIGWVLHPDVQGRGLATEGARELLRLGFVDLGLHRITADCDARHAASQRVMERLGMRREAELVENDRHRGEWTSEIVYAILGSEWRSGAGAQGLPDPARAATPGTRAR